MRRVGEVVEASRLTERVKLYRVRFGEPLHSSPGQFVMVWLPRVGEVPISVAREAGREIWLVIAKVGRVTTAIHEQIYPGSLLWIRGPYGRGFSIGPGRRLLVGGGYGVAPLLHLADGLRDSGAEIGAVLGFRSLSDAILLDEFAESVDWLKIATEDGSLGVRGVVTDFLDLSWAEFVYASGPEPMLARVVQMCNEAGVRLEASLERLIRCGIGLCGACVLEPHGMRVCRDGPVFDGMVLGQIEGLGRYWRDGRGDKDLETSLPAQIPSRVREESDCF